MSNLTQKTFKADIIDTKSITLNGVSLDSYSIMTETDSREIQNIAGDLQVRITPDMLDENGDYVIKKNLPDGGNFKYYIVDLRTGYETKIDYFISPTGSDSNPGTYTSPKRTSAGLSNKTVVLKNGTYSSVTYLDQYVSHMSIFAPNTVNCTFIGETKTGVYITRGSETTSRDKPLMHAMYDCKFINMRMNRDDVSSSTNYVVALFRGCAYSKFYNVSITTSGNWSWVYQNDGTWTDRCIFTDCTQTGGTQLSDYSGQREHITTTNQYIDVNVIDSIYVVSVNDDIKNLLSKTVTNTTIGLTTSSVYGQEHIDLDTIKINMSKINILSTDFKEILIDLWV